MPGAPIGGEGEFERLCSKREDSIGLSFPRSRVGMHPWTLLRPDAERPGRRAPTQERGSDVLSSPPIATPPIRGIPPIPPPAQSVPRKQQQAGLTCASPLRQYSARPWRPCPPSASAPTTTPFTSTTGPTTSASTPSPGSRRPPASRWSTTPSIPTKPCRASCCQDAPATTWWCSTPRWYHRC
ncbi:hypothetical protein D3C78_1308450 [compost metagenome]